MTTSIEAREAAWKKHLQNQTAEYEHYDRYLSDKKSVETRAAANANAGYSAISPSEAPGEKEAKEVDISASGEKEKKEKKEKKDKKEGKEKKEKKEKSEEKKEKKAGEASPVGVTVLGGRPPTVLGAKPAEKAEVAEKVEAEPPDEADASPQLSEEGVEESAAEAQVFVPSAPARLRRSGDLAWPRIVISTRVILMATGRVADKELLAAWEADLGFALQFPIFGLEDWTALLRELQPGALTIVDRRLNLVQASSDAAMAREMQSWANLEEKDRVGTASEWLVASIEKELKAVRQKLLERRRAKQDAASQGDKIRAQFQALQAAAKGQKTAQIRGTKSDLDKQDQRALKFQKEAEELETQEAELAGRIAVELKESGYDVKATAPDVVRWSMPASAPSASGAALAVAAPVEPEEPSVALVVGPAAALGDDDFM